MPPSPSFFRLTLNWVQWNTHPQTSDQWKKMTSETTEMVRSWGLLGWWHETLWLCQQIAIENGPVEIVDFPINSMVIFHSYVKLPEGTSDEMIIGSFPKMPRV